MADHPLSAAEERTHPPGTHPDWEESWYFDFVCEDGALAGFARIALRPADGWAWWWAGVVGDDLSYVLVRDHEVDLPRRGSLEVRAPGLWAEPVCETPFDHWSLGLEALAVSLDDPLEAYGGERGERTPLGFDLEWEMETPPAASGDGSGYRQAATVHGDVLVASRRLSITARGERDHRWGPGGWTTARSLALGQPAALDLTAAGLLAGGRTHDGRDVVPVLHAPLQVPGVCRLARAACRIGAGWGWAEARQPACSTAF